MRKLLKATPILALVACSMVAAAQSAGSGADPHAGHAMPSGDPDGPWSYKGRENPEPYTHGRVEMVPMGDKMQYRTADRLSAKERCAVLTDQNHMAVDRATRQACGQVSPTAGEATPGESRHEGHDLMR